MINSTNHAARFVHKMANHEVTGAFASLTAVFAESGKAILRFQEAFEKSQDKSRMRSE